MVPRHPDDSQGAGRSRWRRYALIESLLPHQASPPLHTHPQDESFIVLEGEMTIWAGTERFWLAAGGVAAFPAGVPRTFRVDSDTARVMTLSTPAGIERFVRAAAAPAGAPTLPPRDAPRPSPEQLAQIFHAHGCVEVGPPLRLGPPLRPED